MKTVKLDEMLQLCVVRAFVKALVNKVYTKETVKVRWYEESRRN